jgi:hypothetical protein
MCHFVRAAILSIKIYSISKQFGDKHSLLVYKSQQDARVTQSLFYLTTALHVSGLTITHLQEHKTTVTIAFGNHYTVLLSAAIVEKLELV